MAGGKRSSQTKAGQQPPPFKKRKRSKAFWQQRETLDIKSRMPNHSDQSDEDSDDQIQPDEPVSQYQSLLSAFSKDNSEKVKVVDDEDKSTSEESEAEDSGEPEEESTEASEVEALEEDSDGQQGSDESEGEAENSEPDECEEEIEKEGKESDGDDEFKDEDVKIGTSDDPFVARVSSVIPASLKDALDQKEYQMEQLSWKELGNLAMQLPKVTGDSVTGKETSKKKSLLTLDDEEEESSVNPELVQAQQSLVKHQLKPQPDMVCFKMQLRRNLSCANGSRALTGLQNELLSVMASYKDLSFNQRTIENGEDVRTAYTLHCLNHVLKTRTKVLTNNERLARLKTTKERLKTEARDQGLCRPKVVIVVPFKESARRVVATMRALLFGEGKKSAVANGKKFDEEFGKGDPEVKTGVKPDDFYHTFSGNTDDAFRIGLTVSKNQLKLYTEFYSSDIIIASPLGLRMVIGAEGEDKRDYDFLTSVEVLVMDQVDIFAMQNWEHITSIVSHVNLDPVKPHGVDFSRVRMWALDKLGKYYRQTLIFSSVVMPEVSSILGRHCTNYCGRVRQAGNLVINGSICRVVNTSVPVVFRKFAATSLTSSADDRFQFFVKKVMPDYVSDLRYRTLIFVPSYFDFVRLRNWFDKESFMDFAEICEYTKYNKMASARDKFFHGEHHFLLYTERAHFYKRFAIKGLRHLIFYQTPHYPHFFPEICNLMQSVYQNKKGGSDGNMSCTVLYSKYDVNRVAAAVGTERTQVMLKSDKSVHMFDTGKSS